MRESYNEHFTVVDLLARNAITWFTIVIHWIHLKDLFSAIIFGTKISFYFVSFRVSHFMWPFIRWPVKSNGAGYW